MNARSQTPPQHWPLATGTIALLALALFGCRQGIQAAMQYDAQAIRAGEWWRLFTQHLVHWGGSHLGWDLAVFVVLGAVCEWRDRSRLAVCLALAAPAISLAFLVCLPELEQCRGLSGLDSALFAMVVWELPARRGGASRRVPIVASALFLAKCGYEQFTGQMLFADGGTVGAAVVPLAHIVGFLCGLLAAVLPPWNGRSLVGGARVPADRDVRIGEAVVVD